MYADTGHPAVSPPRISVIEVLILHDFDVVVVGAGPSGSAAAFHCARLGLRTLLLEKAALPRDKPCGGAVMYRGLRVVGTLPRRVVEREIYGMRFRFPDDEVAEFRSQRLLGVTVFRSVFDEFLARRAVSAGAELLEQARVVDVSVTGGSVHARLSDGREFVSRLLIAADGVNTTVGRSVGLRPPRKDLTRVGIGMEADFHVGESGVLKTMGDDPSVLEVAPHPTRLCYGWVFPKREHLAIGVAGGALDMHPLRTVFDEFVATTARRCGLLLRPEKRRTHFLGGWGLKNTNVTDHIILVGDAAGWVDPMMGEGIAYAMRSGVHAAHVAADAFEAGRFDAAFLSRYQELCSAEFGAGFSTAGWVGGRGIRFVRAVLMRAARLRLSSEVLAMLARGEIDYSRVPVTVLRMLPREIPFLVRTSVRQRLAAHPKV